MALINTANANQAHNPFEAYGLAHLSPSSCNTFLGSPAMFVLQKCMKKSTSVGAAAHRGTSTESGVAHGLLHPEASIRECVDLAVTEFDKLAAFVVDPRKDKERDGIPGMVEMALGELRPYGVPTALQGHVSHQPEGLDVPIIGYFDFEWGQHGVLTDLKTSHAQPSAIKVNHARQVSLYKKVRGVKSARVTYCTSKKVATYELENYDIHLKALETTAKAIQRFLSLSADPRELASYVVPDVESFYFNDPITRQAAFEVWGI
jgi:hypothetical protein